MDMGTETGPRCQAGITCRTHPFILAGWLIDGTGGPIRENVLLNVISGQIISLKKIRDGDLYRKDMIDLSKCTLLPGLVDTHTHLFMSGTSDPEVRQKQLNATFEETKETISRHIRQQLAHGVVAVRDGGDYAGHALRYKLECLSSEGLPICLHTAGKAWRAPGRYGKLIGRPPSQGYSLAQAIKNQKEDIDHVKIVNSGLNSLTEFGKETPPHFNLEELRDAVRAADDLGLRVMVHANGVEPVKVAVEAGCHTIEHGFFMGSENLRRLAKRQITWIPTACTMKAYHESPGTGRLEKEISLKNLLHQMDQISQAAKYGTPVAIGTDCGSLGVHHGSAFMEEFKLLIQAGIPLEKAVQCATLNGARALGLEGDFGRLDIGMPATFVAATGGPSHLPDALKKPEKIFIRGEAWELNAE